MIWQTAMLAMLVLAVLGVYGKHTDGDRVDAANLATGVAVVMGVLLIATGLAGLVSRDGREKPAVAMAGAARTPPARSPAPTKPDAAPLAVRSTAEDPVAAYKAVEGIMARYGQLYRQTSNEIRLTDLRYARGRELCALPQSNYATVVRFDGATTDKEGDATARFTTESGMELVPDETFARGTAEHDLLGTLEEGDRVVMIFGFEKDGTGKDCFHSHRWTERNDMVEPQWDVHVMKIAVLP